MASVLIAATAGWRPHPITRFTQPLWVTPAENGPNYAGITAQFSFRFAKHSGGQGETKAVAVRENV